MCRSLAFRLLRFRRFSLILRTDLVNDVGGGDGGDDGVMLGLISVLSVLLEWVVDR